MAPAKHSRRRKSLTRLSDDQRAEIFAVVRQGWREKPETGYSVRQIAAAVGISKSTLYEWVTGPLEEELQAAIDRDRAQRPQSKQRNHPAPDAELVHDQVDQGDPVPDQGTPVPDAGDVVNYRPDLLMGGIKTSRGVRSEGVQDVEIRCSVNGTPLCSRCGQALEGSARDATFVHDADGNHRPCHPACLREGERLTGWPALPGQVLHVPSRRR